jgi:hypothetical protein
MTFGQSNAFAMRGCGPVMPSAIVKHAFREYFQHLSETILNRLHRFRCVLFLRTIIILCCNVALWGQNPDPQPVDANQSWTRSGESHDAIGMMRYVENHTESGDRTSDTQSTMHRLADGRYEISLESLKDTVRINSSTVRTDTRTYTANANGGKKLVQVTEEEMHFLPDGDSKSMRTVSRADLNGNLEQVQRTIAETSRISVGVEETKTTVFQPSINGGFAAALQIEEHRNRAGNNTEYDQTTRTIDGGGNWQVTEVRRGTIQEDEKNRTTDERVFQPDYAGNLSEVSRTVSTELENGSGEKGSTIGGYSIDLPGTTRDGELHLVQRKTTTQSLGSNGQQTSVQQVERPNPGDPRAGLRVVVIGTENTRTVSSGTETTRSVQVRDANGNFDVVSVDISKSNQTNAVQVQIAPSNNSTN